MLNTNQQNSKTSQARTATELKEIFFPQIIVTRSDLNPSKLDAVLVPDSGIPIRDYFARAAMQTLLSELDNDVDNFTGIARDAYRMADIMISARNESPDHVISMDDLARRHWQQYDEYCANGGTMSIKEWKDDGRFDPSHGIHKQ